MFVKICGNTSEEDALLAVALGADAVGFVMAPSPRKVTPAQVGFMIRNLPPEIMTVGVFRNELAQRVVEIVNRLGLSAAQLHGHETPEDTKYVAERVGTTIKAFRAGDMDLPRASSYGADLILLDGPHPGSGKVFDWKLAENAPGGERVILAGGLDPYNVADAIRAVRPWGVDVASGVESTPGHKDPRKLAHFIEQARSAEEPQWSTGEIGPYDWQED